LLEEDGTALRASKDDLDTWGVGVTVSIAAVSLELASRRRGQKLSPEIPKMELKFELN